MIASRISQNSSDINEFQKAKPIYQDALKKSGYDDVLPDNPVLPLHVVSDARLPVRCAASLLVASV